MNSFDQAFQEQLAAHYLRDDEFVAAAGNLVQPEYFDDETLAQLVAVQGAYLTKYGKCPSLRTFIQLIQRAIAAKQVKIADIADAQRLLGLIHRDPLADRQFVIDTVAEFARHQALMNSILVVADALDTNDADKINKAVKTFDEAKAVGAADAAVAHDYKRQLQDRLDLRLALRTNTSVGGGITTGNAELDKQLTPWLGWGRKELSILMGPPKSGKTAALISFSLAAAAAGKKVFYASCEVSEDIIGLRSDANISGVPLKELDRREPEVIKAVSDWAANPGTGEFIVQAFPIRTLTVGALKRLLKKYEAQGIKFDMVVVDYGDILKPETQYEDIRHGLGQIFQDLRGLATEHNCAVLTATQTNREGTKKAARNVTDGTDAAEDYEKVRTADALITINASEADKQNGEVVLYFSEMRNAESGLRMRFSQDITCMRFITQFIRYD